MDRTSGDLAGGGSLSPVQSEPARAFRRRKSNAVWIALLILIAFAGGIAVAILVLPDVARWWDGRPAQPIGPRLPAVATGASVRPAYHPADAATQDLLAVRMGDLEGRMVRINVQAQAAADNAARAEGLLVAFAARRALDSGSPLGYVEGQLRLRFGQAQPRAVATIINAAREPVTLMDLQGGLEDIAPRLRVNPPGTRWWTAVERELRELVVIRKATTPSLEPDMALPRIRRLLAAGRVEPAMTEVERLPGKALADRWLQIARRYREARRALDLIETAALLESRQVRTTAGDIVTQTSPLAP